MAVQTEYEGKNVDEALQSASKNLNIPLDKIQYEVITYGNSGFLGFIGVKKAKIKVNLSTDYKGESGSGASSLVDEAFDSDKKTAKSKKSANFKKPKKSEPAPSSSEPEKKGSEKKEKVTEEKKISEKASEEKAEKAPKEKTQKAFDDEAIDKDAVDVSDEAVEKGRETLEKILMNLSDSFEILPEIRGNEVLYNLKADNPGVIIGKKGQNLESMQFLVDKIVNKLSDDRVRVLIDIEDYLERRKQNLRSIALRYAEKVKKTGKPSTIGQLSSYERRFIHIALRDDRKVRTQSMGEGYYRKLVVFPSRKFKGKRKVTRQ
ncbi:MAG: RNA-binding cell elongation regulator Jag/EloR [Thermodesulfobacteriota bacterium]